MLTCQNQLDSFSRLIEHRLVTDTDGQRAIASTADAQHSAEKIQVSSEFKLLATSRQLWRQNDD